MEHILSLIGLAKKAGRVEIGEEPVGAAARAKHARLILLAQDAGGSSVRRAYSFAETGACLCLTIPAGKDRLGGCVGRTSVAMLAITDIGFAEAIGKKLAKLDPKHYEAAAQALEVKAKRAAQRKQEQLQHEKNIHSGKKKKETPAPQKAEEKKPEEHRARPAGDHKRPARPSRPDRRRTREEKPRFAGSRPVKKGKGSVKKKK